ncbi:hypothetical protein [Rhodococcus baikonurensis]|uniref:Uncharacterized protein n=1 Tax=Rhodococcus baikonurensis TaxID=172041 RepID=A0ABV5XU05_9NOCA
MADTKIEEEIRKHIDRAREEGLTLDHTDFHIGGDGAIKLHTKDPDEQIDALLSTIDQHITGAAERDIVLVRRDFEVDRNGAITFPDAGAKGWTNAS